MNEVIFNAIKRAVRSLENSTDLWMDYRGVRLELSRRRSPYKSHHGVTFSASSRKEYAELQVWNNREALELRLNEPLEPTPNEVVGEGIRGEWRYMQVPRAIVDEFHWALKRYFGPSPFEEVGIVWVGVLMPVVERFEGRTPIFARMPPSSPGSGEENLISQPEPAALQHPYAEELAAMTAQWMAEPLPPLPRA